MEYNQNETILCVMDIVEFEHEGERLIGQIEEILPDTGDKTIAKICNTPGRYYFVSADKITREITEHSTEDFKVTIDGKSLYPEPENPDENKFVYSDYGNLVPLSYYAKMHKVSPDTVRQKILRGNLSAVRIGRNWCIDKDEPYVDTRVRSGKYKKQPDAARGYSEHYPMACELIGSNGYRILTTDKLSQYIAVTEIREFPSKLVRVTYLDSDGQIIAEGTGVRDRFPRIGYVDESIYKKEKAD